MLYQPRPTPQVLLAWLRQVVPDLRLGKALGEGGQRVCLAKFTLFGEEVELAEAGGDEPDERLIYKVGNVVKQAMGIPTELDRAKQLQLERDVMAAAAAGQTEHADRLGRELVMRNAAAPRLLAGRVGISTREIW